MKITESKIKRLIKYSLMHEVVDLATGNTQFDTVRFAKCEKIEMPPVFRQIFFDKAFGLPPFLPFAAAASIPVFTLSRISSLSIWGSDSNGTFFYAKEYF